LSLPLEEPWQHHFTNPAAGRFSPFGDSELDRVLPLISLIKKAATIWIDVVRFTIPFVSSPFVIFNYKTEKNYLCNGPEIKA
jgi:hypothetical protein